MVKNYVVPLKQLHTQVRQFLGTTIDNFLKRKRLPESAIQEFHSEARSLKSPKTGKKEHVSGIILEEIAALTEKTERVYEGSCSNATDLVTGTRYCEEAEWDGMRDEVKALQQKITRDYDHARKVLEQMTDVVE
jgi:hypothetical protein